MQSKFSGELRDCGLSCVRREAITRPPQVLMRHKIKRQRQIIRAVPHAARRRLNLAGGLWPAQCVSRTRWERLTGGWAFCLCHPIDHRKDHDAKTHCVPLACALEQPAVKSRDGPTERENNVLARAGTLIMPPIGARRAMKEQIHSPSCFN